jgi:hypothetical protein
MALQWHHLLRNVKTNCTNSLNIWLDCCFLTCSWDSRIVQSFISRFYRRWGFPETGPILCTDYTMLWCRTSVAFQPSGKQNKHEVTASKSKWLAPNVNGNEITTSVKITKTRPSLWSEFLATDPEVRVRFPALSDFMRSSGPGTGVHSASWLQLRIYLEEKVVAPV